MARAYLKGLPQLKRKLGKLKEATREPVKAELAKQADRIVAKMRSRAKWKHVRDTIDWSWGLVGPRYSQRIASGATGDLALTIHVGNSDVRDAHWLERGTKPHVQGGMFAGKQHPGTPPNPYFYVSYRELKASAQRALKKAIREAVKKAVQ